jgi:predicted DNA-binding transcriptional regulator AlpA
MQHSPTIVNKRTPRATIIPDALKNFDQLPDSANVRLPVVAALFACSPATVWRWAKAGIIPKPKSLGGKTTVWNVGELRRSLNPTIVVTT